ncbi:hypothetical protein Zmor_007201 [Zophobas morio]|uniref:Uncharacterized protein n=1 Tax=Zophobas morio TaxID=2755281 RepID=A0AA38IW89_9CUCU|nr:hypothetical protein Zmor_007201 [Zophobas morio]
MNPNLANKESQIIEIEDDVIDLDEAEKTPEEVIYEWDAKIRKKLSAFGVADNERVLGDLMKDYLQSLHEMTRSYDDNETLKNKVFCHINFLYSYYVELQCCTSDNYLSNMEEILTLYCNLELEAIRPLKKKDLTKHKYKKRIVSVAKQIIHVLTVYLLERHDHILHVLIKMNTNKVSDSCSEMLNILYSHFLTKVPAFNLCDDSFCRNYIVFQKWKEIRKVEDWEGMDKIMYKMFKRTPESIKNNETLRQILMPSCSSTVDIVLNLFRSFRAISSAYFKHVLAKRNNELDDLDFNIDLGEDEPTIAIEDEDEEEVQFLKAYYEVERNMTNLSHTHTSDISEIDIFRKCKEEFDEDDDVQFVGITMLPKQPILEVSITSEDSDYTMSNTSNKRHTEKSRIPIPTPPLVLNSVREKNPDLENLNGITRICVGSPRTVPELELPKTIPERELPRTLPELELPRTVPELDLPRTEPIRIDRPIPTRSPRMTPELELSVPTPEIETPRSVTPVVSPLTVPGASDSCQTTEMEIQSSEHHDVEDPVCTITEVTTSCDSTTKPNQPEVSFDSNNTQISSPSSPAKAIDACDGDDTHTKRTIEMKSVEVQADGIKNYLYNDYGLTTPPFDVQTDEQVSRPVEPRLYTNIGQNHKKDLTEKESVCEKNVSTRTIEVQVDVQTQKTCPYNDYGLTPPNDPHIEDPGTRLQEPLYTNIGHKDLSSSKDGSFDDSPQINTHNSEIPPVDEVAQDNVELETDRHVDRDDIPPNTRTRTEIEANKATIDGVVEHESDFDEFEDQLDISDMTNADVDYDTEEIDVESCQDTDKESPLGRDEGSNHAVLNNFGNEENVNMAEQYSPFKKTDQIDTGQKLILKSAPNIEPVTADSELKEVGEIYNGNTILKPLVSSNRTNGQAKDSTSTKIMYTSSQRIRPTLEEFSRFENAIHNQWNKTKENHDFDAILTGPVSKVLPVKQNSLFSSQDKLDLFSQESNSKAVHSNSRSNSPNDMTSPAYEAIDDFRNYYSDSVNGRVPPPHDVRVPRGILKKTKSTRRKNYRIMFHESTCDNEERKPRSDGVLVLKSVRMDEKLNMEPRVLLKRRRNIEDAMKKMLNKTPTLRVDYDKTTTHINDKDVVRCISPPTLSFIVKEPNSHNPGKVKSFNDAYCKKASSKCEKNMSSCCNQLAEEFTKLNCNVVEDKALNLTITELPRPIDPESEFSNSPTFLPNTDQLVQHCLEEATSETPEVVERNSSLLCDNSNFYTSSTLADNLTQNLSNVDTVKTDAAQCSIKDDNNSNSGVNVTETVDNSLLQLPTAVPETYDFEKNFKNEVFSKIDLQNFDDSDGETRLPLKKRKLSVANKNESVTEELKKEEISYPATPMISIAEVEALHPRKLQANAARPFKTPAERKEMPPLPVFYNVDSDPSPIITDQFNINNHTYNNPTINYHMNNVPVPFINIPCGSYYSLPPILVPFNNVSTFEQSKLNTPQQENFGKKESRKQGRRRRQ